MRQSQVRKFGLGFISMRRYSALVLAAQVFSNSSGQREQADEIVECAGLGYHPWRLPCRLSIKGVVRCYPIRTSFHSFDFGHHSVLRIGRRNLVVQRGRFSDRWRAVYGRPEGMDAIKKWLWK